MKSNEIIQSERLTTHFFNETSIEHLHRYALALEFAKQKNVLDIACGEGYGTNIIATEASKVTAIDIDKETIKKAKTKYPNKNIEFIQGDILNIPIPDAEFDLIICLETLEHVENQKKLFSELKRTLKPNGILIISSPNKEIYSDKRNFSNPFHKKELYFEEFKTILHTNFKFVNILSQLSNYSSLLLNSNGNTNNLNFHIGNFTRIKTIANPDSMYFIGIASNLPTQEIKNSIFISDKVLEYALVANEKMVTSTITYKLGHFLLYPFKALRKLLQ